MVELINIKRNRDIISCDYIPENSGKVGKVSVDIKSQEVNDFQYSEYEYGKNMYVAHVRAKLVELLNTAEKIPSKATAIWY